MKNLLLSLLLVAAGTTLGIPTFAANLVKNGSFEDSAPVEPYPYYGEIAEWTPANPANAGVNNQSGPFWDNSDPGEVNGKQVGFVQGAQTLSQDVDGFVKGQQYTLTFLERKRGCCGSPVPMVDVVVWVGDTLVVDEHEVPQTKFATQTMDFTAAQSGVMTLLFEIILPEGGDATFLVDAVSIVPKGEANPFPINPSTEGCWQITAIKTDTPPTIDGVLDVSKEYAKAQVVDLRVSTLTGVDPNNPDCTHNGTLLIASTGATVDDDADSSGKIYLLWDKDALYIAVDGKDESMNPMTNPCGVYECSQGGVNAGDTFQFCIDYDSTEVPDGQVSGSTVYIPSWALIDNTDDVQYFQQFWPLDNPCPLTGIHYVMKTNAAGYVLETKIPWSAFTTNGSTFTKPFPPVEGQTCGVLPMLEDHDPEAGQGITFLYTAGGGANIIANAGKYSTMTFKTAGSDVDNWALFNN